MEIKALQIEQMLTGIIAERDGMILELNQKTIDLTAEVKVKDEQLAALRKDGKKKGK